MSDVESIHAALTADVLRGFETRLHRLERVMEQLVEAHNRVIVVLRKQSSSSSSRRAENDEEKEEIASTTSATNVPSPPTPTSSYSYSLATLRGLRPLHKKVVNTVPSNTVLVPMSQLNFTLY